MSFEEPAEALIEPAVRPDALEPAEPDAEPEAVPAPAEPEAVPDAPEPLALLPVEPELDEPELMLLLALPNFAFFSTKPLPAPVLLDALLELLALLEVLSRCRQPVAVICPAVLVEELLPCEPLELDVVGWLLCGVDVVGWLLCGVDEVGACAASVPQSATPLHSVTAHCQ